MMIFKKTHTHLLQGDSTPQTLMEHGPPRRIFSARPTMEVSKRPCPPHVSPYLLPTYYIVC